MESKILISNHKSDTQKENELHLLVEEIEKSVRKKSSHLYNATISHGWLGASLFYFYYASFTKEDRNYFEAENYLRKALDYSGYNNFERKYPTDSYDANIAGLGIFLIKAVENGLLSFDVSAYLQSIEDTLHELCRNKIKYADFSIFSGALATGNFLLRAKSSSRNDQLLGEIVEGIESNAISDSEGGFCWSSPRLHDRVYIGLSHGACMIISFLSDVHRRGIMKEKCRSIINKAIIFVLSHKEENGLGLFPHFLSAGKQSPQFTLCYGDLGVGYGLLKGSLILKDKRLIDQAKEIIDICSFRKFEDKLTFDAGITYGASGIAFLYEKISQLDPEENMHLKSYQYWISKIVNYSTDDNEYCGFKSSFQPESDLFNVSYGWGIMGIGTTLMRHLNVELPNMEGINHGI